MKIRYLKFKNWLILSLMGALGLGACHSQKEVATDENPRTEVRPRNEAMLLYGVPPVNYQQKDAVPPSDGKIVNDGPEIVPDGDKKSDPAVKEQPREEQPLMYGVPTVNFKAKGKVVDAQGRPVKGVQVVLLNSNIDADNLDAANPEYMKEYIRQSGDTTAADGTFECQTNDRPWDSQKLLVRDIDGKANGSYKDDLITVDFPKPKDKNMSGWNLGTVEKTVTVKLKKK